MGQWFNDLKHGVGVEEHPSSFSGKFNKVTGLWYHNLLNGVGILSETAVKGKGTPKKVIFKDNMSIEMSSGSISCLFYFYILLTFCCYGGIIYLVLFTTYGVYSPAIIPFYWIMSCCTKASKYIYNATDVDSAFRKMSNLIAQQPQIRFHIECYHYETYTTTDSEGKT